METQNTEEQLVSICRQLVTKRWKGADEAAAKDIFSMNSSEGEKVLFTAPVTAVGNVESWLGDVEEMMKTTLYDLSKESLKCYPPDGEAAEREAPDGRA